MSNKEIELYLSIINPEARILEFGSGNSTRWLLYQNINYLYSVETDIDIIHRLEKEIDIKNAIKSKRLYLKYVDIGPTGQWGFPKNRDINEIYLNYTQKFWHHLNKSFSYMFIDGRFRMCTALFGLLYLPNAIFAFHDFFTREYYYDLLKFVDLINYVDSLIIYKKRNDFDTLYLLHVLLEHIFDPR